MAKTEYRHIEPKWLDEVASLKGEWDKLHPISEEADRKLLEKFRLEWNYNSNHIEGNTLTYGETKLLLIFDKTDRPHEAREFEEMKAHDVAIKAIEKWALDANRELTETDIKDLNRIILVEPFYKPAEAPDGQHTERLIKIGNYKEFPNSVRLKNGEMFHFASPQDTPILMGELMKWMKEQIELSVHPLVLAAQFHYKFIRIHPFDDGNGRVARLLVNYFLIKSEYPPIIVKSSDKENYLFALQRADSGDLDAFTDYMARQLIWSLELCIKAAKGENIEEPDDLDKKLTLFESELDAITTEDEIKVVFDSNQVLLKIFDSWLSELIKKIIPIVQKFNKYYTKTDHYVLITARHGGFNASTKFIEDVPENVIAKLREQLIRPDNIGMSGQVNVICQSIYSAFKKSASKPFGCQYSLTIFFEYTSYKIIMDEFSEDGTSKQVEILKRLLDKVVTTKEIEEIAKKLGDILYRHMEFYTQQLRK